MQPLIPPLPSPSFTRPINIRMHHPHVAGQGIIPRERFFLSTQMTANLLLARIMDGVLMTGEVVRAREDGIARFARGRVGAFAFVRTGLRVAETEVGKSGGGGGGRGRAGGGGGGVRRCLPVGFTLVLLKLSGSLEAKRAASIGACVSTTVGGCVIGSLHPLG